ncbi:MAG TPA: hypothetical protein VK348_08155 [Planctomycetota bacterium]|nr:hypothetical protein [Planctomycetota bacterium]
MKSLVVVLVFAGTLGLWPQVQGPPGPQGQGQPPARQEPQPPAPPPEGAKPLPPVDEPYVTKVRRDDLLQRFEPDDPLLGMYRLRLRVVAGVGDPGPGSGYLVLGRRHLVLYLLTGSPKPDMPMIRAGVRRYTRTGETLTTTVVSGHYNEVGGAVKIEQEGAEETRRLVVLQDCLRIYQDDTSYLEFVRLE